MDFETARKAMVDSQVRPNDVTNHQLLHALETVPKEIFLPGDLKTQAYVEKEIEYAPGRSLATARDFAKLLEVLNVKDHELVLDVACGSGYSTAVLAKLCEMVVAVEGDEALTATAEEILTSEGINNAAVIHGEPAKGAQKQGPYDVVLVCGVIEQLPDALLSQVKDGGRLGTLHRENGVTKGVVFYKNDGVVSKTPYFMSSSRAVLPGFEREKSFVF